MLNKVISCEACVGGENKVAFHREYNASYNWSLVGDSSKSCVDGVSL